MFVPIVLSTILENPKAYFIVYTDKEGMFKLFNELKLENCIILRYAVGYVPRNPLNVYRTKKRVMEQLRQYKLDDITFYHTEYGDLANYIISKYSAKVPVFFQPPYKRWDIKADYRPKSIYYILRNKIEFNTDIIVQPVGDKLYFTMSEKFYKKNRIIEKKCIINHALISSYIQKKYHFDCYKNKIVLMNGAVFAAGIDCDGYQKITDDIINFIGKDNIFSKCHPRYLDLYGLEKELNQIPSYIPVSLLLNCFDIYIGYWSTGLVEAAQAGKISISTLYIMPQTQVGRIEIEHKVLEDKLQRNGIIYYPKTIFEFKSLLSKFLEHKTSLNN